MSESEHMFTEFSEKLLKNSRTTLLDLDWFYDILDLLEKHQGYLTSYQHTRKKYGHKLTLYGRRNSSRKSC